MQSVLAGFGEGLGVGEFGGAGEGQQEDEQADTSVVKLCSFPDCGRKIKTKKSRLCKTHYEQNRSGEELKPIRNRGEKTTECGVPDCNNGVQFTAGYCHKHYARKLRYGDPLVNLNDIKISKTDEDGNKQCKDCRNFLPLTEFHISRLAVGGVQQICKKCSSIKARKRRYGINIEEEIIKQGFMCANAGCKAEIGIFGSHVDHWHECCPGENTCGNCVRGILCGPCNQILGIAKDSAKRLRGAAEYLEQRSA